MSSTNLRLLLLVTCCICHFSIMSSFFSRTSLTPCSWPTTTGTCFSVFTTSSARGWPRCTTRRSSSRPRSPRTKGTKRNRPQLPSDWSQRVSFVFTCSVCSTAVEHTHQEQKLEGSWVRIPHGVGPFFFFLFLFILISFWFASVQFKVPQGGPSLLIMGITKNNAAWGKTSLIYA